MTTTTKQAAEVGGLEVSSVAVNQALPPPNTAGGFAPPTGLVMVPNKTTTVEEASRKRPLETSSTEQNMKEAAEMLNNAALAMKRRRCLVAVDEVPGFVRTVYTLLRVCDPDIIAWSQDGTQVVIKASDRFATEVCPKFFRHRNFNSFTRLLNMYQFHKVPASRRDAKEVCFEHPHFQRGREDLLPLVQRKGAQLMREELMAREIFERNLVARHHQLAAAAAAAQQQQRGGQAAAAAAAATPTSMPAAPLGLPANLAAPSPRSSVSSSPSNSKPPPAAGTPAAALESALQPIHQVNAVDPSGWMTRMTHLEAEVKALKNENDRLKSVERDHSALQNQLKAQAELISALQAQASFLGNCAVAGQRADGERLANVSDAESDDSDTSCLSATGASAAAPPGGDDFNSPEFQELMASVGGPVGAMAMMMGILSGTNPTATSADAASSGGQCDSGTTVTPTMPAFSV